MKASTRVQEDAQVLESLPVFNVVPWKQIMALLTFHIAFKIYWKSCMFLRKVRNECHTAVELFHSPVQTV